MTRPVPHGSGRADGGRAVVTGCDEPLARGGGAVARVGAVRFGAHRVCRRAFRDAQVCCGWAGGLRGCHGVVTSGAKHGGTEADTLRRFLQVGGRGGTSWGGRKPNSDQNSPDQGLRSQSSVAELGWVSQLVGALAASANEKYRVSWENSVRLLLGRSTELSQLLRLDRPASSSSDASELDSGEGLVAR